MVANGDIVDQAIAWHLRLPTASDGEWMEFVDWLEADGENSAAYDRIVQDDVLAAPALDLTVESRASVVRVVETRDRWRRRGGWMLAGGSALAASLAVAMFVPGTTPSAGVRYAITTAPGEHRDVILADGSRVEMNGGTRLTLDRKDTRYAALDEGQATFHVTHNPKAPFELMTGGTVLRDIGTVFDVTRENGRLGVQVAEGAVMYQPSGEALTLRAGMSLVTREGDDRLVVGHVPAETVGGWRQRRLTFRETPLRAVAAEVRRTTGQDLVVRDAIADLPFTGSIRLVGDEAKDAEHVAALAGTDSRQEAGRWILTPRGDALN